MMCITLTPIYAQTNVEEITSDTIITEENIDEVLEYLGLDSSKFIKTSNTENVNTVCTVGELEKAVLEASKEPKVIRTVNNIDEKSFTTPLATRATQKTKMLYFQPDYGTSYDITYSVAATYAGKSFISANSAHVDVDSDAMLNVYKISSPSLKTSCSSDLITLYAKYYVDTYVGVFDKGLFQTGHQKIDATINWSAKKEL